MTWLDDPRIDLAMLERYGFDRGPFLAAAERFFSGALTPKDSLLLGLTPPPPPVSVPAPEDPTYPGLLERGEAALRAGRVAVVVLNGGMATRFGGVVKGTVPVLDDKCFIAWKAQDAVQTGRRYDTEIPFVLMNSFATDAKTQQIIEANDGFGLAAAQRYSFCQSIALRLGTNGLFEDTQGALSYYAPGHGDFFPCIRKSGVLKALLDRGVDTIWFSNVDNLGATIDPVLLGLHLEGERPVSIEVVAKERRPDGSWETGGSPATHDGQAIVAEGFRIPDAFPQESLPDFSTNTMLFDAQAIDTPIDLPFHVVRKKVDGREAVQLERIACEITLLKAGTGAPKFPFQSIRVPRRGKTGRFFPIKAPADLATERAALRARLCD